MSVIVDFLSLIGDAITGVIDFVVSFVMDIVYIIQVIGSVLAQIPAFLSWLPSELSAVIVAGVGIAAIYKIAGR